jgi:hypothetical protein
MTRRRRETRSHADGLRAFRKTRQELQRVREIVAAVRNPDLLPPDEASLYRELVRVMIPQIEALLLNWEIRLQLRVAARN